MKRFIFTVALALVPLALCALSAQSEAPGGRAFFREGVPELASVPKESHIPNFAALAKALSSSVVNISVEGGGASNNEEQKSNREPPQQESDPMAPFRSSGSGFFVSSDGYIVTSNHVVERSDKIIVRLLNDRREYVAKVIGKDKKTDIALLKIDAPQSFPFAYLGDSDSLEVGEWALAIGNQFELGQTVTAGIVSAKSRRVPSRDPGPYDTFIQTDASINPGSSGGPLFNTAGQVVGVNTAIFTPGRGGLGFNIGIGFAIPINLVKEVVTQLKSSGRVTRGMLGVLIQPISKDMAEVLSLPDDKGALVAEVVKEGPADKAGFQPRDVIVTFDGKTIEEYNDLPRFVAESPVGKQVAVELVREGKPMKLTATVAELKEQVPQSRRKTEKPDSIGLRVDIVPEEIKRAFKIASDEGIVVLSVEPNSAGERAGMMPGDIILEIAGEKVRSLEGYQSTLKKLPPNRAVLVVVQKKDGIRFLALRGEPPSDN